MSVPQILRWEVSGFLALLVLLLAYQMATGKIHIRGLFGDETSGDKVSPERVLLFAVTLAMAAIYVVLFLLGGDGALPHLGAGWITIFGAGCGTYAAVKAFKMLGSKRS